MLSRAFESWKINSSMRDPVSTSAVARIVSEPPSSILRAERTSCADFQRALRPPRRSSSGACRMNAVVGAGNARERIHQYKSVLAGFDDAPATLNHETRKGGRAFQIHVVRRRNHSALTELGNPLTFSGRSSMSSP